MLDYSELDSIVSDLKRVLTEGLTLQIDKRCIAIIDRANVIGKSWSGSNIGYHARVYYKGYKTPKPDDMFDRAWGLKETYSSETSGKWVRRNHDTLYTDIISSGGIITHLESVSKITAEMYENLKRDLLSILTIEMHVGDQVLKEQIDVIKALTIPRLNSLIEVYLPNKYASYDEAAMLEGPKVAPHQQAISYAVWLERPFIVCRELIGIVQYARKHLQRRDSKRPDLLSTVESNRTPMLTNRIFIVHGHDGALKHEIARLVEKIGLDPIILHEKPSQGKTIIEKLEYYTDVSYAIVLYTPCDVGRSNVDGLPERNRARQNVVFEHGYLVAKLGRDNVAAIVKGDIELPSDNSGVIYIECFDGWKMKLFNELKAAGLQVLMDDTQVFG